MDNTLDSSYYEIIRDRSSDSFALLSETSDKQVSKTASNELLQVPSQGIKVYLRFKPENDSENKLEDLTYSVVSQTTLLTKFPNTLKKTARNLKKLKTRDNSVQKKFLFTQILKPDVSQETIFEQCVKPELLNLLSKQNSTVIMYGTRNSGKTYTLFGIESNPGIIPRCIDYIFSTIRCTPKPRFKPINGSRVILLNEYCQAEAAAKSKCSKEDNKEQTLDETRNLDDSKSLGHDSEIIHSIWLSFGEIYNEAVYDLLSQDHAGKNTRLKLVLDKDGNTFVKGLRMVHATSALEAHQIFTAAASRLRVAASSFCQNSSRSHAIFTIKLLKYTCDSTPESVVVSTLNLYDLAGPGRLENISENDQILIESRYINKSLLALGRCIKIIAQNHATKQNFEVGGPFRGSCLTRLLQKSLCEKEAFTIFVNLNTSPAFYVEAQNILGLVSSLKILINTSSKDTNKLDDLYGTSISRTTSSWDVSSVQLKSIEYQDEANEKLRYENEVLLKELELLKSSIFERECEIRQEFADMYTKMIKDHDESWRKQMTDLDNERQNLLKLSIRQVENYYEEKIDSINRKRKRIESGDGQEVDMEFIKSCDINNSSIVKSLKEVIKGLRKDLEVAIVEKNDCKFTLTLIKNELQSLKCSNNSATNLQNIRWSDDLSDQQKEEKLIDLQTTLRKNSQRLKEIELLVSEKSNFIQKLQTALAEKDSKLAELGFDLTKSETIRLELTEKLIMFEQILIHNNIDFETSELNVEILTRGLETTPCDMNDSELSFLYTTNNDAEKPGKVVARISKDKFSLISSGSNQWSVLESSIEKSDQSLQSSDNGSKNDSGIISEGSKTDNEDKEQTTTVDIKDRVTQLKEDYTILKSQHQDSKRRVADLSQELEVIKHLMTLLKESSVINEHKLLKYEDKLFVKEEEIHKLRIENRSLQETVCQTSEDLNSKSQEHIRILQELNERLKIREERDTHASKFFEDYMAKSLSLENKLSVVCTHLEKKNGKCFAEHMTKIEELEKELLTKNIRIAELSDQILVVKQDLNKLYHLDDKVIMLEEKITHFNKNKEVSQKQLSEKLREELCLELKFKNLSNLIDCREKEIEELRKELEFVMNENMTNKENAKKLSDEIAKSDEKMTALKEELSKSEEIRVNLERTLQNEIGNLCPRLLLSDKNVVYVNSIQDEIECKQLELDALKVKLQQQDQDMDLIRKNRDFFVERYKSLVEKLKNGEQILLPNDFHILDYVTPKIYSNLEIINSDRNETSKSESQCSKLEISDESNVSIKPSISKTSVISSSSTDSMVTVGSMEMLEPAEKFKSSCRTH